MKGFFLFEFVEIYVGVRVKLWVFFIVFVDGEEVDDGF